MIILWDIDGTLMYCGADGTKALNNTFEKLYGIKDAFSKVGIGSAMDTVILDRIIKECAIENGDIKQIKRVYIEELDRILAADNNKRVLPGVLELLTFVTEEGGINVLLTSNLKDGALTKLASVDLLSHFEGHGIGGFGDDHEEKWLAAQDAVKEAEEHLGKSVSKNEIVVIGDSVYDIRTAKKIGARSIAVGTGWTESDVLMSENPDYFFEDLGDVKSVKRALLEA